MVATIPLAQSLCFDILIKKRMACLVATVFLICCMYGVSGYQTIQWFPKGSLEPKKYEGQQTAKALAEFVNTKGGTNVKLATVASSVVVLTPKTFDSLIEYINLHFVRWDLQWTNYLNPSDLKGLSAFSMLLAMLGNGFMIPHASDWLASRIHYWCFLIFPDACKRLQVKNKIVLQNIGAESSGFLPISVHDMVKQ